MNNKYLTNEEQRIYSKWNNEKPEEKKKKINHKGLDLKELVKDIIFQNGSTWCEKECLYQEADEYGLSEDDIDNLFREGFLTETDFNDKTYASTTEIANAEKEIAELIWWHAHKKVVKIFPMNKIMELADRAEKEKGIVFAPQQKNAIIKAINAPIMVITGVPGAGKTTIIESVKKVFSWIGLTNVTENLAPTGKASKRMAESLNDKAMTVDMRLLTKGDITAPVTFIDESSFLDTVNLAKLLKKAKRSTHIIFLGDVFQLSSVGCGMILRDLIDSGIVRVSKLDKSFRVDKDAKNIQHNVQLIRDYKAVTAVTERFFDEDGTPAEIIESVNTMFTEGNDFHVYKDTPKEEVLNRLLETYENRVKKYGRRNVCMLIPFRDKNVGEINSERINAIIEKKLFGSTGLHVGSQVMQTKNRPYAQNGSIGQIISMAEDKAVVKYDFGDVTYVRGQMKELKLAYAMSVHKSQGSEYDSVILATLDEHKKMLNRNLIYTAITRAKKEVDYFFDSQCLYNALNIEASEKRVTMLLERLKDIQNREGKTIA